MAAATNNPLFKLDHYEILSISAFAELPEINKSYRKLALKYHPDRNRGNQTAADVFVKIKESHAFLTDEKLKAEYDGLKKKEAMRKEQSTRRNAEMGDSRKKMKDDLEAAEAAAAHANTKNKWMGSAAPKSGRGSVSASKEEALRKEGEKMRQGEGFGRKRKSAPDEQGRVVKMKWSRKKAKHDIASLTAVLAVFGTVEQVTITADNTANAVYTEVAPVARAVSAYKTDKTMRITGVAASQADASPNHTHPPATGLSQSRQKDFEDLETLRRRREAGRARAIRNMARADRREAGEASVSSDEEDDAMMADEGGAGDKGGGEKRDERIEVLYAWPPGMEGCSREKLLRVEQNVFSKLV